MLLLFANLAAPVITSFWRNSLISLICTSATSPATSVLWTKDGTVLSMDGSPYHLTQVVTDRRTSTYNNMLTLAGDLERIEGDYTCTVSNRFGSSSRDATFGG